LLTKSQQPLSQEFGYNLRPSVSHCISPFLDIHNTSHREYKTAPPLCDRNNHDIQPKTNRSTATISHSKTFPLPLKHKKDNTTTPEKKTTPIKKELSFFTALLNIVETKFLQKFKIYFYVSIPTFIGRPTKQPDRVVRFVNHE